MNEIRIDTGPATFKVGQIPVTGEEREVIAESIEVGGRTVRITAVSLGNPHCVVFTEEIDDFL